MRNTWVLLKLGGASLGCFWLCWFLIHTAFSEARRGGPTFVSLLPGLGAGIVGLVLGALAVVLARTVQMPSEDDVKE